MSLPDAVPATIHAGAAYSNPPQVLFLHLLCRVGIHCSLYGITKEAYLPDCLMSRPGPGV